MMIPVMMILDRPLGEDGEEHEGEHEGEHEVEDEGEDEG